MSPVEVGRLVEVTEGDHVVFMAENVNPESLGKLLTAYLAARVGMPGEFSVSMALSRAQQQRYDDERQTRLRRAALERDEGMVSA